MAVSSLVARWEAGQLSPTNVSLPSSYAGGLSEAGSEAASSPELIHKPSLIDLKDWVVELEPDLTSSSANSSTGPPLIQLNSPPALPPRKPSIPSLRIAVAAQTPQLAKRPSLQSLHTYPPSKLDLPPKSASGHAQSSSVSSFHSISLSSDPATPNSASFSHLGHHMPDGDPLGLEESFENVSTSSLDSTARSLLSTDLDKPSQKPVLPPRPPQRPPKPPSLQSSPKTKLPSSRPPLQTTEKASSSSLKSSPPSSTGRRAPPPPPPSRHDSDKASISSFRSTASSQGSSSSSNQWHRLPAPGASTPTGHPTPSAPTSKGQLASRPTPVPSVARKRYESVFNANVIQGRKCAKRIPHSPVEVKKARNAAGWRGLSVDLIDVEESYEEVVDEQVGPDDRLGAKVVKKIWSRSMLSRPQLKEIWNECVTGAPSSLDREAFIRGMWRIDEELRKIKLRSPGDAGVHGSMALTGTGSLKIRQPLVLPKAKPKPILR